MGTGIICILQGKMENLLLFIWKKQKKRGVSGKSCQCGQEVPY
ncbi:hypothetical protein SIN_1772 [Streptococcus infantis SK1302]|uniref:Uncharacterized protein n=1 Tax=Streptococcus infantis SK1302 TaxID=871237 RepID=A0ABN0B2S5_9STRE|nr:hypothetical protein SIN_1772 [Streptococcus infantis SK1302]